MILSVPNRIDNLNLSYEFSHDVNDIYYTTRLYIAKLVLAGN